MVGVETVLKDNPLLTTRLPAGGLSPTRVIVDSWLRTPEDAQVIRDRTAPTVILTTEQAPEERIKRLAALGIKVVRCGEGPKVDLQLAMKRLGEMEISSVLLEGGGKLNGAMLASRLVDKVFLFFAPKIVGGDAAPANFQFSGFSRMADAITLQRLTVKQFGDDVCIVGYPCYGGEE
jgi:diaminohydroxyphosphoribosylaminopyrimidine deaminase/5-amino-6-(5-phosphoribosylamino)uracil reductase